MTDRVALITGGSRGVGRAIAVRLAADGHRVAVNYRRDSDAAAEVVELITAAGGAARAYRATVDDQDAVATMLDAVAADFGVVDIVVSNAGTASTGRTIAETPDEEYLKLLRVHTLGPLALIRRLLPAMRSRGRADIVMVSSAIVDQTPGGAAPYTMAKVAMEAAIRTLAREERGYGIRANIVAPGLVTTEMGRRLVAATGDDIANLDADAPFGRVCRPEDVAGVVGFLVSPSADYLTGQRIRVDGGGPDVSIVGH